MKMEVDSDLSAEAVVNIKEEYEADTDDEDDQKPSVVISADMKKEEYSVDTDDEEE